MGLEKEFEDERIIRWRETDPAPSREDDPTILAVDLELEEIYESRLYQLRPDTGRRLGRKRRGGVPLSPFEQIARAAASAGLDAGFKLLAKRDRTHGEITFIVVLVTPTGRGLLFRAEAATDALYREFAEQFETAILSTGLVGPPAVMSREEWRRYEPKG